MVYQVMRDPYLAVIIYRRNENERGKIGPFPWWFREDSNPRHYLYPAPYTDRSSQLRYGTMCVPPITLYLYTYIYNT